MKNCNRNITRLGLILCIFVSCTQSEQRFVGVHIYKNKLFLQGESDKMIDSILLSFEYTSITDILRDQNYADCGRIDSPGLYDPYIVKINLNEHPLLATRKNFHFFCGELIRHLKLRVDTTCQNVQLSEIGVHIDKASYYIYQNCKYNFNRIWPNYIYYINKRNGIVKYNYIRFNQNGFDFDLILIRLTKDIYTIEIYNKVSRSISKQLNL